MGNMTCRNVDPSSTSTASCDASQSGATMSYDNTGQLTTWKAPTGSNDTDQFLYDNSGNRVLQRASSSGTVSDTVSFGGYTDVTITGGTTSTTKYYTVGGQKVAMRKDGTFSYLLPDMLGSSTVALTSTGAVEAAQLYSPFGSTRYSDGTMSSPFSFTGQRLDSLTVFLYYGARYYDPVSGRFISADDVENNASGNDPYAYVKGNPETATDPSGNVVICMCSGGGGKSSPPPRPPAPASSPAPVVPTGSGGPYSYSGGGTSVSSSSSDGSHREQLGGDGTFSLPACDIACFEAGQERGALSASILMDLGFGFYGSLEGDPTGFEEAALEDEQYVEMGCSFVANTVVTTVSGKQPIGSLKPGETVQAYDSKTKKMEAEVIRHVWIDHDNDLVDVTLTVTTPASKGKAAHQTSETLHTNQRHPFLTVEKGFVPVSQLHLGMHVLEADGHIGEVTGWKSVPGIQVMYNLEVTQDHTFTVGTGQWVVHNDCGDPITFNQHVIEKHIDPEEPMKLAGQSGGQLGLWNSQSDGEAVTNYLVGKSTPDDWKVDRDTGYYALVVRSKNIERYGGVIDEYHDSKPVLGVKILMTDRGTGNFVTAYPIGSKEMSQQPLVIPLPKRFP